MHEYAPVAILLRASESGGLGQSELSGTEDVPVVVTHVYCVYKLYIVLSLRIMNVVQPPTEKETHDRHTRFGAWHGY